MRVRTRFLDRNNRQSGLTLVEMMVAIVLGLIVVGAVIQLFLSNKVTYRTQQGLARVQESGRYAMHRVADSIRNAGFFGCAGLDIVVPKVIGSSPPSGFTTIDGNTAVYGEDNVASGNTYGAVVGSDVLTLRGSNPNSVGYTDKERGKGANFRVVSGSKDYSAGDFALVADCEAADLFKVTGVSVSPSYIALKHEATGNTSANFSKRFGSDSTISKPFVDTFYVKDTGRDTANGLDIYALYMRDISGADLELIEGISKLQVIYGVDNDGNREADIYMTATAASSKWDRVVSIRISILVDSIDEVLTENDDYEFQGTTSTASDKRLRQAFTGLFTLRNRAL